tara:strand:+ start:1179 stop:1379 length:201 start_codon:yes stop_codon:yes gene_type:complete
VSLAIIILQGETEVSNKEIIKENSKSPKGHGAAGIVWGVKNPGKVANKHPKNWGQKGMKKSSGEQK